MYYDLEKKERIKAGDLFRTNEGCDALVVEYNGAKNIIVEFQDSHKHRRTVTAYNLKIGEVKNHYHPSVQGVGYIGHGKHKTSVNGKRSHSWEIFKDMMERCYSPTRLERFPTYEVCSVAVEWHNFQVFAEWYESDQFHGLDYHLDKDLLVIGNKIYSPDACAMVPIDINNIILNNESIRGDLPIGVGITKSGKYTATVKKFGKNFHIGVFETETAAYNAYVIEKEKHVKYVANLWRGKIDEKVYHALMNWTVE